MGNMKENLAAANGAIGGRMTRSRAAALGCASSDASRRDHASSNSGSTTLNVFSSRSASSGCFHRKRKTVLQDVTNSPHKSTCVTAIKGKSSKQPRNAPTKAFKPISSVRVEIPKPRGISGKKIDGKVVKKGPSLEKTSKVESLDETTVSATPSTNHHQEDSENGDRMIFRSQDFLDIDSDKKNPLLCTLYAPEIYKNLRVAELVRRPKRGSMEMVQRDITKNMRGILIDWLVEASL